MDSELPPIVPYKYPFLGSVLDYGAHPIQFLHKNYITYGPIFTMILFGKRLTYTLGPEGNNLIFNAKTKDVSAEEAYYNLTVPVFGKEVVYDVPNAVLMEQKKLSFTLDSSPFSLKEPVRLESLRLNFHSISRQRNSKTNSLFPLPTQDLSRMLSPFQPFGLTFQ